MSASSRQFPLCLILETLSDIIACDVQETIPPTDTINRNFVDLIKKLLAFDPAQRITVRDALAHPYFALTLQNEL